MAAMIAGCGSGRAAFSPSPEAWTRKVADRVLTDFPKPVPFDWGEGVLLAGMMRAGVVFSEPRYVEFVRSFADHWSRCDLPALLADGPTAEIKAYCGYWGPAYALVLLHEQTREPAYLRMAEQVGEFILTKATRTPEGGLGHWGGNYQLWVDTLYMVCPAFARLGRLTGRAAYMNEALRQLQIYRRRTLDEKTGLFWHMYDDPSQRRCGALWGRGNGWVAMAYAETAAGLDRGSPEYRRTTTEWRHLLQALERVQDPASRLWHTVLDHPETYLETSASAMILSSMAQAKRMGVYSPRDSHGIQATWTALAEKVDAEGRVFDVSGGTMPGPLEMYATKTKGTETWGTGAFLLAGAAVAELAGGGTEDAR